MTGFTWRALAAATVVAIAAATSALAGFAAPPRIEGDAVVGSILHADVQWEGELPRRITYLWVQCDPGGGAGEDDEDDDRVENVGCVQGRGVDYRVRRNDVGLRLQLLVRARGPRRERTQAFSEPTAVVQRAPAPDPPPPPPPPPAPPPPPDPAPSPSPPAEIPSPSGETPPAATVPTGVATPGAARYLRPFPVVRIKGSVVRRGARVTLLRVTASRRAKVRVRCRGKGCPVRRLSRRRGRIGAFERFLRARVRITIRVSRPGFVGKHVRLVIRAGRPPARRDACIMPGDTRAVTCPPA
jgi:hypothetical protein